jgi:hypothetical protein
MPEWPKLLESSGDIENQVCGNRTVTEKWQNQNGEEYLVHRVVFIWGA